MIFFFFFGSINLLLIIYVGYNIYYINFSVDSMSVGFVSEGVFQIFLVGFHRLQYLDLLQQSLQKGKATQVTKINVCALKFEKIIVSDS